MNGAGKRVPTALRAGLAALLLLAAATAYAPSLSGGFLWDDDTYVTENRLVQDPGGLSAIWSDPTASPQYYPLVFTTFWAEQRVWGDRPLGYRLLNLVLHVANAVLLALVLEALDVPGAWLAGAIFALHPVHVESVAWIAERKNVLSGFFGLSALLAYLRYRGFRGRPGNPAGGKAQPPETAATRWGCGSAVGLFLCALLSKTVTATLPAAVLAILWWKQGRLSRRDWAETAPFLVIGAGFGVLTAWLEKTHVGAEGADWALSWAEHLVLAGRVPFFYLGKLLWPADLSFVYRRWELGADSAWPYLYPAALAAILWALWRLRVRVGRGPLTAALCFLVTLAPVLGILDVFPMLFSYVADHFQYLASAAPIALGAAGVAQAAARARRGRAGARRAGTVVPAALVLLLAALTWGRAHAFRSPEALWRDTLEKNPRAWLAHTNLGVALASQGKRAEAAAHYRQALRIKPDIPHARNNLASLLAGEGRVREAEEEFLEAWKLHPNNYVASHELGRLLEKEGRLSEAERFLREAVRAKPDLAGARYDLALLLARTGRAEESIPHFRAALTVDPNQAETHFNLAVSLDETNRSEAAAAEYRAALALDPSHGDSLNNLGTYLGSRGDLDGAAELFSRGVASNPGDVRLRMNLGRALALRGRLDEALVQYREAVRLAPEDQAARQALEEASAEARREQSGRSPLSPRRGAGR